MEDFLNMAAIRACQPEVMRQLEGGKARELLVACACLGCTVPSALSSAILEELVRESGKGGRVQFLFGTDPKG